MNRAPGCAEVRESLSSLADGEQGLAPNHRLEAHLGSCEGCSAFAGRLDGLNRRLRLRAVEAVPNAAPRVISALAPSGFSTATTLGAAFLALGFSVPALFFGLGHVALDPSHVVTPCTHGLMSLRHLRPGRS